MSIRKGAKQKIYRNHFHYVPVLQTLKSYLQQADVWASIQNIHRPKSDTNLHDFTDGLVWNMFDKASESCFIRIHLYGDEVEMCNPIGSRKSVHKLSAFYFLVGNIGTKHWSSLSNIHLALLFKYKYVKQFGYDRLLTPLLSDIQTLETEGIAINVDGKSVRVYGSIVTFSGDNLSSHDLGGFSTCFSSGRVCRQCMVTKAWGETSFF